MRISDWSSDVCSSDLANADLDRAGGIEHAVEHRVAEGSAVVELRVVEGAAGVAVGVDVDHADRPLTAPRLPDRVGDRVVAADRERRHAGRSEERRVGEEWVSTCRSRGEPYQ